MIGKGLSETEANKRIQRECFSKSPNSKPDSTIKQIHD
jgi:hypothetical protein